MPDVHGDRATHDQHVDWTARKRTALRRPMLDCGHANRGEVFYHAWCDRLTCSTECAEAPHDCSAFAGVKSSSEEESEPVEAATSPPMETGQAMFCRWAADMQRAIETGRAMTAAELGEASVLASIRDAGHHEAGDGSAPADAVGDLHDVERLVSRAIIIDPSIMFTDTTDHVADDPRLHAHEVDGITGCPECPELRTSWWSRLFPGRSTH